MTCSIKNGYLTMTREQNIMSIAGHEAVLFLEKYDELSNSIAFGQKVRYFTDQNGDEHENEF